MASDFSIKPIGASNAAPPPGPAPVAAKAAVPTQLPADKAVTAPDPSVATRNNAKADTTRNNTQVQSNHLSRQTLIDSATSEVIFRVTDSRTHIVVRQTPDESRLRLRAYFRAQDAAKLDKARSEESLAISTDRTA